MQISIYGDSILKFVRLEGRRYTADRSFEQRFAAQHHIQIRNRSYFGAVIDKGLSLLRRDLSGGLLPGNWAVLEFGGNDCNYVWEQVADAPEAEHLCQTPPETFVERLREGVRLLREADAKPILTALPPLDPQRYFRWITRNGLDPERILRWLGDINLLYRWNELYSRLAEQTAREEALPLVDLRTPFLRAGRLDTLLCEDGIHPNREGQGLIYDAFCTFAARLRGRGTEVQPA